MKLQTSRGCPWTTRAPLFEVLFPPQKRREPHLKGTPQLAFGFKGKPNPKTEKGIRDHLKGPQLPDFFLRGFTSPEADFCQPLGSSGSRIACLNLPGYSRFPISKQLKRRPPFGFPGQRTCRQVPRGKTQLELPARHHAPPVHLHITRKSTSYVGRGRKCFSDTHLETPIQNLKHKRGLLVTCG